MAVTFIPGYLATLSYATVQIEHVTNSGSLRLRRGTNLQPTAGVVSPEVIGTLETGELTCAGHCTVEDVTKLNIMWAANTPVAFEFQIGEFGADDAGSYDGNVLITDLSFDYDAEAGWSFALDGVTSGAVPYTEPV